VSLEGELDSAKYKECYDIWMKSYEKMLDDILALPAIERAREIFGEYICIPDVFSEIHKQMARLRKDSYARIYKPWIESMVKLSDRAAEISKGKAIPEDYREFYNMWINAYQKNFGRVLDGSSAKSSMHLRISCKMPMPMRTCINHGLRRLKKCQKRARTQPHNQPGIV
jgi:hypothetical protein